MKFNNSPAAAGDEGKITWASSWSRRRRISTSAHLANGLTNHPEPIDSQFVGSYPMVLNLLKAHTIEHVQPILEKSFAQFQLNQRADTYETKIGSRRTGNWRPMANANAPIGLRSGNPLPLQKTTVRTIA